MELKQEVAKAKEAENMEIDFILCLLKTIKTRFFILHDQAAERGEEQKEQTFSAAKAELRVAIDILASVKNLNEVNA